MPVTTTPLIPNTRSSPTSLKLVEASGLQLPAQPEVKPVPVSTETVSLRSGVPVLSDAKLAEISSLKARDSQVRQHEQAHLAASGGLNISKAAFTYQRGPDGVNYAVGGDVRIDTSQGRTAADSLARGELIIDVALAPADPSPSDRSAASKGQNMAQQARAELLQQARQARQADTAEQGEHQHAVSQMYGNSKPADKKIDTYA